MKDYLGHEIPEKTRATLYLGKFTYNPPKLEVIRAIHFEDAATGLHYFSEIPNPESQIAMSKDGTREAYEEELTELHSNITNPVWLADLGECL